MANEFRITKSIVYENGQLKRTINPGTLQLPQASQGVNEQIVSATTAEAAISFTGITTPGFLTLQSLEATTTGNTVDYGPETSTGGLLRLGSLGPKEFHDLRLNTTSTLRVRADEGTVNVSVILFED